MQSNLKITCDVTWWVCILRNLFTDEYRRLTWQAMANLANRQTCRYPRCGGWRIGWWGGERKGKMRRRRRNKKKMKGGDLVGGINGRPSYSRSITRRLMRDPDDMRGYYRSGNNYHARRTWTVFVTDIQGRGDAGSTKGRKGRVSEFLWSDCPLSLVVVHADFGDQNFSYS